MSKLESALKRAKELHDTSGWTNKRQRRRTTDVSAERANDSEAWRGIGQVKVDETTMARHRIALGLRSNHGAHMAYNMLRTRLIRRMRDNNWSSLIVSSPDMGAGKTVTSINLATAIAREQGQSVYLVDLDLREPSLHKYLGVTPDAGLTEYLDGKKELVDVVTHIGIPRLFFVFNAIDHEHSAEMLTSQRMGQFIDELRAKDPNGLIIYDAPPMLVADDVLAFSPRADAILLVVAEGETKRDDLQRSIQSLTDSNLLGIVLNKSHDVIQRSTYY